MSAQQQSSYWDAIGSILKTGRPTTSAVNLDTYLTDLTTIGPEGEFPGLASHVYADLDAARLNWLDAAVAGEGELGGGATVGLGAVGTFTIQAVGAFALGYVVGTELDHVFHISSLLTGVSGQSSTQTLTGYTLERYGASGWWNSPDGWRVGWRVNGGGPAYVLYVGDHHAGNAGQLETGEGLGAQIAGASGKWDWYQSQDFDFTCTANYCDPSGTYGVYSTIAVIQKGTPQMWGGAASGPGPSGEAGSTQTVDPPWPALSTTEGQNLKTTLGATLSPVSRAELSHVVDPTDFPDNAIANPSYLPVADHYVLPSCDGLSVSACETAIDDASGGTPTFHVQVAGIDGAVLTMPPATVVELQPAPGTSVTVETEITIIRNPDTEAMPYVVPAIGTDDTYDTYKQKLPAAVTTTKVTAGDASGDPQKGPNAVITVTPAPGTRQAPGAPVVITVNPPDWPQPGDTGAGVGCPTPLSTVIDFSPITAAGLQNKFPFAVFAWLHTTLAGWAGTATAPSFTLQVLGHSMHFDMSLGNGAMSIIRDGFLAITLVALVWWLGTALLGLSEGARE
jgi:hypothetical protein